jgi:hypothetical protein
MGHEHERFSKDIGRLQVWDVSWLIRRLQILKAVGTIKNYGLKSEACTELNWNVQRLFPPREKKIGGDEMAAKQNAPTQIRVGAVSGSFPRSLIARLQ